MAPIWYPETPPVRGTRFKFPLFEAFLISVSTMTINDGPMTFSDRLLDALGGWQRGWMGDETLKLPVTDNLLRETAALPAEFRVVPEVCFRKRFLFKKDMESLIMFGGLDDGVASWSTDLPFTMNFKGLVKKEAATAVYFEHRSAPAEVIVNFPALWANADFQAAAEEYRKRGGSEAYALFNFVDRQSEIILHAHLHLDEVKQMVGASGSFDAICDEIGVVGDDDKDRLFKVLTERGVFFESPHWISLERTRLVFENTRLRFLERNAALIEKAAADRKARGL
jgi:hypothetical protein